MAINFPSNPSNGDTHAGFTYNSTVGAWESTASNPVTQATLDGYLQVANSSSGTTVYSAISDLPLSGNESGAQAYVSGTNRLYLWTGTGWYNIALINTNPSLSGASATYSLNTDGSNTVVTLASTDPEGLPISFSVSHSGIGVGANAIATVTQSNNIFTFTPTTNTSLAGTFTTTFTASDGVNLAVANSSFTLSFASPIITTSQHGSDWNSGTISTHNNGGTGINVSGSYAYELTGMTSDFGGFKVLMPDIWTALDDDDGLIVVAFTNHSATFNNRGLVSIGISDSSDANQIIAGFASYATSSVYQTWLHPSGTTTVGTVGGTLTINSDPGVGDQANWDLAMRHRASTNNLKFWVRPKTGSYANQWVHIASHSGYTFTPANFRLYVNQRILTNPRPLATLLDATSFTNTLTF